MLLTGPQTGLFTSTMGFGRSGDIVLQAPRVTLAAGATISAGSAGPGSVGNITIVARDSFLSTEREVVARATQLDVNGGNIEITAGHFLRLRDSTIRTEVGGGPRTGRSNLSLSSQFIVVQSQILADAFAGMGGNRPYRSTAAVMDPRWA